MYEKNNYEVIKNAIECDFIEYMEEEHLTVCQTVTKILEEDSRRIRTSDFVKYGYILSIAIECLKKGEIADFIFEKLDEAVFYISEMMSEDKDILNQDVIMLNKLKDCNSYKIIETSIATKISVDYFLNME